MLAMGPRDRISAYHQVAPPPFLRGRVTRFRARILTLDSMVRSRLSEQRPVEGDARILQGEAWAAVEEASFRPGPKSK